MREISSVSKISLIKAIAPNTHNVLSWLQALVMIVGLFWWGWSPLMVVMAYFFETIIIGVIHVVKMAIVLRWGDAQNREEKTNPKESLHHPSVILFFMVHYNMFVAGQSIFIFSFFSHKVPAFNSAFNIFENYGWLFRQQEFVLLFAIQGVTQLAYLIRNWLLPAKYREQTMQAMFMQPYLRIFIQQFATIFAGFFFIFMQSGIAAALLLILLRLVVDCLLVAARYNEGAKEKLQKLVLSNKDVSLEMVEKQIDALLDH